MWWALKLAAAGPAGSWIEATTVDVFAKRTLVYRNWVEWMSWITSAPAVVDV
jgi:hypothetical protein